MGLKMDPGLGGRSRGMAAGITCKVATKNDSNSNGKAFQHQVKKDKAGIERL